jgi:hypothetical protein
MDVFASPFADLQHRDLRVHRDGDLIPLRRSMTGLKASSPDPHPLDRRGHVSSPHVELLMAD